MIFPRKRLAACWLLMAVNLLSSAQAQASLTLADALARALRDSPELRAYPYQRRAAEAEKLQAGLRPNPELGATLENFAGTGNLSGTKSLETTLELSQLIELGDKRTRRVDAAQAAVSGVGADYDIARLDVLAETTRRYIDMAQSQAALDVSHEAAALASQTAEAVERRIQAGAASTAERNRAVVAKLRANLDVQRDEGELDARRIALAAQWGQIGADFTTVAGALGELPPLDDFSRFADRLQTSPDLERLTAERRLREAELQLAQAQAVPDLTVGGGIRRLNSGAEVGGSGADYGLLVSLNLPLPFSNRNQGEIAAARERLGASDAEREAALLRSRTVLYGLYREAVQTRRQVETLRNEALPQAEQALKLTQLGFANGRYSFLELADVQRQLLELREAVIAASADAHRLDAEIERLTGLPIVAPATSGVPQ